MLTNLSNKFYNWAKGWLIFIFLIGEIIFNAIILPNTQAKLEAASGGNGPLDLLFFYTPETAYSMVESYGEATRAMYATFALTGDVLYPLIYTFFFGLLISWLFQRGVAPDSKMRAFNVVPVAAFVADILENICIFTMLTIYPTQPPFLAWVATVGATHFQSASHLNRLLKISNIASDRIV